MKLLEDFRKFLEEYRIVGLAIAFVIGNAVSELVKATVNDLIMPVVEIFLPEGDWQQAVWTVLGADLRIGHFLAATIDFVMIALIIFLFVKYVLRRETVEKI